MHDANLLEDQPIAWTPTPDVIERARLTKFMKQVGVSNWDELYEFSINDVEKFTEEVIKFLDIKFDPPYKKLLDTSNGIEFPVWFGRSGDTPVPTAASGGTISERRSDVREDRSVLAPAVREDKSVLAPAGLNITEMCLDRWVNTCGGVIWEGEDGTVKDRCTPELFFEVKVLAAGLRKLGFGKGDAIGIHLPMMIETVVALLAINRIGAIAVPVFSGYGVDVITSRMNAVGARALFTCDGFSRRGKFFNAFEIAEKAVANCHAIQNVFVVRNSKKAISCPLSPISYSEYESLFESGLNEPDIIEHTSAEDPLIILYTSGTTGKPKGIAHTHASFPIKAAQDMAFGTDVGMGTRISWYTDIGWMMGPWLIYGALINGATICIYDGAPDYPTPDRMWEFCAKHNVEVLGISPTLVRSLARSGDTLVPTNAASAFENVPVESSSGSKSALAPTRKGWSLARSGDTLVPTNAASAFENPTNEGRADEKNKNVDKSVHAPSRGVSNFERRSGVREDKSVLSPERKGWSRTGKLPHFDGEVTQLITFRLRDSLPQPVLERLKLQLEHDKLSDDSDEYRQRIEDYLDEGAGECLLRDPKIAAIVEETLLHEHGTSCDIKAWVIMPNHAHVLVRLNPGYDLASLMKRVKGISAKKINIALDRTGSVWQADYFDRYIRDADHFAKVFRYIENNPVVSKLVASAEQWKFGSASARSGDTLVPIGGSSAESSSERRSDVREDRSVLAPSRGGSIFERRSDVREDKSVLAPPHQRHDLSSLRIFASTGEPWNPAPWWWLFESVGNSKLPIINYSGGTEIAGGILMGNPLLPIKPCSFPAPCPGMDVDILDENGKPVKSGEVGELVIKQPWIGMARGFWQEKERYLETYWRRFKDIWVHGDFAMRDKDGHWFILGRSDDTLKVAGKRVGPAEVESILVSHPAVIEAAVIGVPDDVKGTAMVAFVVRSKTRSGDTLVPIGGSSAESFSERRSGVREDKSVLAPLEAELKALVARDMGKPLAPSKIHFVSALPKTRNAKVMRRVIRSAYLGQDPGDLSALENPKAVEGIGNARNDESRN